jgi:hypothetical protein
MADRRVVHSEIVTDLAHDNFSRVKTHSDGKTDAPVETNLIGVSSKLLLERQSGVTRALRVVFVGDRCTEQRHDPVAGVLVDRTLEAVHALGEDRESQ